MLVLTCQCLHNLQKLRRLKTISSIFWGKKQDLNVTFEVNYGNEELW